MQAIISTEVLASLLAGIRAVLKKAQDVQIIASEPDTNGMGEIKVTAYQDLITTSWRGIAEVSRAGSVAVRADTFVQFVEVSSKADKTLKLETYDIDNQESLRVITSRGAHEFKGCDQTQFDAIDPGATNVPLGDLSELSECLKLASTSAEVETAVAGARIAFSGVHVHPMGAKMHVVGTNGHRLAWTQLPSEGLQNSDIPDEGITIPKRMIPGVCTIIAGEPAAIRVAGNTLIVENSGAVVSFPMIEVPYPDTSFLLKTVTAHSLTLPSQALMTALVRTSAAIGREDRYVSATLNRDTDGIHLSSFTTQQSSSELLSENGGQEAEISFNTEFMKSAVDNMKSAEVTISFTDSTTAILLSSQAQPNRMMIVMPCKTPVKR